MSEQIFKSTLTVDVGDHTGWSWWDENGLLDGYGMISLDKKINTMRDQFHFMYTEFCNLIESINPSLCILEGVEIWTGNLRSVTAASRGNLSKLSYMVGMYVSICFERDVDVRIIPAREWKGQMKDKMVASRVEELTNISLKKSHQHIIDAIGIGLSLQGMFYRTRKNPQRMKRFKIAR